MSNHLSHNIPFINSSWIVVHNSFANSQDGWHINPQQNFNLETLFEKGIRGFMVDIHYHDNEISICHEINPQKTLPGNCLTTKFFFMAPVIKLESFLTSLHRLIVKNPQEIIILFLECYVPMLEVETLFAKTNLTQFILTTNPNEQDHTIGDILAKRTPLIVFSDYANSQNKHSISGFFHTKNIKESKYDLSEYQGCEDRGEWSRTKYDQKEFQGQEINLFLLNHFYKTSFNLKLHGMATYYEINDYNSIKDRSIKCQKEFSLFTNFIAVDYVEEGNWGGVFSYVSEQNYKTLCAFTTNDCALVNQAKCESSTCYEKEIAIDHQDNYASTIFGVTTAVVLAGLTYCIAQFPFHHPYVIDPQ